VKLPLVIALHGAGQDAAAFAEETGFAAAAAARRMMVVFPDGSGTEPGKLSWNAHFCCGVAAADQVDDIAFVGSLIDRIAATHPVDRARIYATGMSNGGMLTHQLAAARPGWFAAIAPVSAAIGGTSRNGDRFVIAPPDRPVPVMIIHGRKDPYVLYDGGSSALVGYPQRSNMAVVDALALWRAADGCAQPPTQSEPVPGRLRRLAYDSCRDGSVVMLWESEDGEHNWPADVRFPAAAATRSAAEEIIAFFADHAREDIMASQPTSVPDIETVTVQCPFAEAVARIEKAVEAHGLIRIATASASRNAAQRGITIPGNAVVLAFNNVYAVRLLAASVAAGIEAPMRIYLTENADGSTRIAYPKPSSVLAPYGGGDIAALGRELDGVFAAIVHDAAGT
jgi:polyhydroxybutyrate depolymerase